MKGEKFRMRTTSFELDANAYKTIEDLKPALGEKTNVAVIRKAIALLAEGVELSDGEGYFLLESPKGEKVKIRLV